MHSSPQHLAPTPGDLSGPATDDIAQYREKFQRRLPESLDVLRGPTQGVVEPPLHIAWSGMTAYDMSNPRQRMGLYRAVLRAPVGRTVRTVREEAFPQLASRTRAAA